MISSCGWCFIVTQGRSCLNFHLCTYLSTRVWSLDHEAPSFITYSNDIAMATFTFEIRDVTLFFLECEKELSLNRELFFLMLFLVSFFLPFLFKFWEKKKKNKPNWIEAQCSCQEHFKFGHNVLYFECRAQQYFPQVTLLLCHEAACQSQCFMSTFPSQSDSGARVMESILHQTGSSFALLSAAQPRAANVGQASLVT